MPRFMATLCRGYRPFTVGTQQYRLIRARTTLRRGVRVYTTGGRLLGKSTCHVDAGNYSCLQVSR
jgi:hypothetical protein